ncbi:TPA: YtxH domain-containing protein [Staphylococcus aureus]|nr:YtxH domain-containing protein [Staphylococcus aureus]HCY8298161.1 YtxH domain-containing protein [Staphylococcus aureus]HDK9420187.1 YtxH domain-containing protein [Staphylococcus aureus]
MKASRILFGIGVGVAAGFVVALQRRDDKSVKNNTIDRTAPTGSKSELQREFETIKQSFNDILNYGVQIKNESAEFGSSIGGEIKSLLGNFKSDINPNIERLQSHIENLQNRGEDIGNEISK